MSMGNDISTVSVSNADGLFNHDAGVSIGCYFNACVNKFNDADLLFEKNEINMVFGEGIIVNRTGGVILPSTGLAPPAPCWSTFRCA